MTTVHPFERAKLGTAPFRCVAVTKNAYQACHGAPVQPGSSCDYCGTGIMYEYWIVSSDAKRFKVGCDCVVKTGAIVEGFKAEKAKHDKTVRDARNTVKRAARKAEREAANAARQQEFARARDEKLDAFLATDEGKAVAAYLLNRTEGFLGDMNASLHKWGNLTDGQLAAVRNSMARDAAAATSAHVGEVGKPLSGEFEILATREHVFSGFPPRVSYWHLMRDAAGNVVTFRGVFLAEKGARVSATFTVKAHEDYKGTKQTVVQRPRKVVTLENAKS